MSSPRPGGRIRMTTIASISVSLDGFVTGPDDRPGQGLGRGGERLHYWVFGVPWSYDGAHDFDAMSGDEISLISAAPVSFGSASFETSSAGASFGAFHGRS